MNPARRKDESTVTERERLLAILNGRQPDQVPWFGDLDYWATALVGRGQKPEDFKASGAYIDWHRDLGVGFYLQGFFPFKTIIENCEVKDWHDGHARMRRIETPHGALQECWTWIPDSFTEGPTEHFVKSPADLPAYRFVLENTRYEPDYAFAEVRKEQIGDMGVLLAYLPKSPFMQLVALDAGIMAVTEIFMDAPDELAATIDSLRESHDRAARLSVESPVEVLMIPENLSSESVGPHFFDLYMKDYQQEWAAAIKAAGKFSCIHLDGTLKGLMREEAHVGLSFLEALTPAPVGDLAVEDWADWVGETDTILWGGIPGVHFTDKVSDEDFERHVRQVLEVMSSEPRYVLGVADQVPPDGLESRVRRVRELVDEFGCYN